MTEKERLIVIYELYHRQPYGIKCDKDGVICDVESVDVSRQHVRLKKPDNKGGTYSIARGDIIKPYLRPMGSMTIDEEKEYNTLRDKIITMVDDYGQPTMYTYAQTLASIGWLYKNHFDYTCLIEKNLALVAKENMYKK
jgi:hypothetical protein